MPAIGISPWVNMGKSVYQGSEKPARRIYCRRAWTGYLAKAKNKTELRKIKKEISEIKERLYGLRPERLSLKDH